MRARSLLRGRTHFAWDALSTPRRQSSMFATSLYRSSPVWVQDALVTARAAARRAARETIGFWSAARQVQAREAWRLQDLRAYQLERLREVLLHATRHVPFYRREIGPLPALKRGDEDPLQALLRFPLLDKTLLRERPAEFIADDRTHRLRVPITTSGTTGTPLHLVQELGAVLTENAFRWRQLRWAGFQRGERQGWIRGDLIVPVTANGPPYWRHNRAERMLMFSSYHLSPSTVADYASKLAEFGPSVIRGYPSSLELLARFLLEAGDHYPGPPLKAVLTSSETVTEALRTAVRQAFGCEVYDWYGGAERVAAIATCSAGRYHELVDYGYTEYLPAPDGEHEIVATGFNNRLMPLIRYRTGDSVRLEPESEPCGCGLAFPSVAAVYGRMEDYVLLPDGRRIGRLDHVFKGVGGVLEAQLEQHAPDGLTVRLVASDGFGAADQRRLRAQLRERLGKALRIELKRVARIPRERSGKFKFVKRTF